MRSAVRVALAVLFAATFLVAGGATSAVAGRYWWVTARVHHTAIIDGTGGAYVFVTYRCMLPNGQTGSNDVYSVLQQHPGRTYEHWDDRIDVDEFSCGGERTTLQQWYGPDEGRDFHRGRAIVTLDVRVCTGDVTDDPGKCMNKHVVAKVRIRPGTVAPSFSTSTKSVTAITSPSSPRPSGPTS